MSLSIKLYEDIDKKISLIDEEINKVSFDKNGTKKNEFSKEAKLHRLCGRREALMWVMGRQLI